MYSMTIFFNYSVGVILGFLSNDKISSTLNSYTSSVDAAIQDGVTYIDNTLDVSNQAVLNSA